jgi:hypothetical protein
MCVQPSSLLISGRAAAALGIAFEAAGQRLTLHPASQQKVNAKEIRTQTANRKPVRRIALRQKREITAAQT